MRKKLQVFVSSTYADLRDERQAAVEAILTAGHIPAGMELFAAGDESQMQVIRRWIEESDVFLLILGGRYGSIEPGSGRSYVQLEYEHAIAVGKPVFAVVVDAEHLEERVKALGTKAIETEHQQELRIFREQVLTRMVRFWRDPRDIKLAIHETLPEYARREDLVGWRHGDSSFDFANVADQLAQLAKENAALREMVTNFRSAVPSDAFAGLSFEGMYSLLADRHVQATGFTDAEQERLRQIAQVFGDREIGLVHLFFMMSTGFLHHARVPADSPRRKPCELLSEYGLLRWVSGDSGGTKWGFNEAGHKFFMRLLLERDGLMAEQYRDPA
ncbi:MAG: DUF4062 domain-containing protein [Longimicrobiaceae bacterium]